MSNAKKSVAIQVRTNWERLKGMPGGKRLFSWAIGRSAPYTATIGAIVDELEPGYAKVLLHDRKKVRNHLNSIHAIALMNLGEITSGLAVLSGMPDDARGILAGLSMEYHKKGRGTLTAECRCSLPETSERAEYTIVAEIRDTDGDLVATANARWLIGPMKKAETSSGAEAAA
jgi:acyl-coenzyme A thioesterase PaaI-like protein